MGIPRGEEKKHRRRKNFCTKKFAFVKDEGVVAVVIVLYCSHNM